MSALPLDPAEIEKLLGLKPLQAEGGLFKQSYRSRFEISDGRPAGTAIYVLYTEAEPVSVLHRLDGDEVWHFYLGDPMEMLLLGPAGAYETAVLGHDLRSGQQVQLCVPSGTWMGATLVPGGRLALIGCNMTPGFVSSGYEAGDRHQLCCRYPEVAGLIEGLTPPRPVPGKPSEA